MTEDQKILVAIIESMHADWGVPEECGFTDQYNTWDDRPYSGSTVLAEAILESDWLTEKLHNAYSKGFYEGMKEQQQFETYRERTPQDG